MVAITITLCLLISPFVLAFAHSAIIFNKHKASLYANYFIVFNVSYYTFINSLAYLVYGDDISKFQGWIYSPAIFQIGIFQLSIFIYSLIVLFKDSKFKSGLLLFFSIYTVLNSFSLFTGNVSEPHIVLWMFVLGLITAFISFVFYRILKN